MPGTTASIDIEAPAKVVYNVVSDFESYPDFLPETREVEVLSRTTKKARASYKIKVIKSILYTLDYNLTPGKKISWTFVDGNLFKDCKGSWTFKETKKGLTLATYTIDIEFGLFVPKTITDMLVGRNLPTMMERFKQRAEDLA